MAPVEPDAPSPAVDFLPIWGVLAVEGIESGDEREFLPDSLRWDLEHGSLPYRWCPEDYGLHQGAYHVAWIDDIQRVDEKIMWRGRAFDQAFKTYLQLAGQCGTSVDCDDESFTLVVPPADVVPGPEGGTFEPAFQKQVFSDARIRGATAVDFGALIQAVVYPGEPPTGEAADVAPADGAPAGPVADEALVAAVVDGSPGYSAEQFAETVINEFHRAQDLNSEADGLTHAGILLRAEDTGRWLMLQRALDPEDENGGRWEFPGGGIEEGESPAIAAAREFAEECGVPLPDGATELGAVDSGIYRLHVMTIPSEGDYLLDERDVINPDDPDGDQTEALAWWTPEDVVAGGTWLRPEVADSDWNAIDQVLTGGAEPPLEEETTMGADTREFANPQGYNQYTGGKGGGGGSSSGGGGVAQERGERNYKESSHEASKQTGKARNASSDARKNPTRESIATAKSENKKAIKEQKAAAKDAKDAGRDDDAREHKRSAESHETEIAELTSVARKAGVFSTEDGTSMATETPKFDADNETDEEPPANLDPAAAIAFLEKAVPMVDPDHQSLIVEVIDTIAETIEQAPVPDESDVLVASAAPVAPPADWFDGELDGPTPLTITADGRVFGHFMTWDQCHQGGQFANTCQRPPSDPEASFFHLGQVITADGSPVDVGRITVGGGHADTRLGLVAALEHYDNASTCVAVVRSKEDKWGAAVFGAVVPEATPHQIAALRRSPVSGDWRKPNGAGRRAPHRLIGVHAVNTPGYPMPRRQGLVASVTPQAYVTYGRVEADCGCTDDVDDVGLVAAGSPIRLRLAAPFESDAERRREDLVRRMAGEHTEGTG